VRVIDNSGQTSEALTPSLPRRPDAARHPHRAGLAFEVVSNTEIAERTASRSNGHCLPPVRPPWTGGLADGSDRDGRRPCAELASEMLSVTFNPLSSPGRDAEVALASAAIALPVARASAACSPGAPRRVKFSTDTVTVKVHDAVGLCLHPAWAIVLCDMLGSTTATRPANALLTGVSLGSWACGTAGVLRPHPAG
jgi:hypothetical protein